MIEVGILGLDTSHPEKFAALLAERDDATVSAVWDDGTVRDDEYANRFCAEHEATRYERPEALVDAVDAAMVLPVDWNAHRPLAVPFLEAGVPTLIDKPLAGSSADVAAIADAAAAGDAALFGGSAVPFHPDVAALSATNPETIFAAGYGDPFYYGVHLVDSLRPLAGADWTRIEPIDGPGLSVRISFENGVVATARFDGPDDDGAFGFLTVGDRTRSVEIASSVAELERMYEPYVEAFVATARGERDDGATLVDAATLLLGVRVALESGTAVTLDDGALESVAVDSAAFVAAYEPYY